MSTKKRHFLLLIATIAIFAILAAACDDHSSTSDHKEDSICADDEQLCHDACVKLNDREHCGWCDRPCSIACEGDVETGFACGCGDTCSNGESCVETYKLSTPVSATFRNVAPLTDRVCGCIDANDVEVKVFDRDDHCGSCGHSCGELGKCQRGHCCDIKSEQDWGDREDAFPPANEQHALLAGFDESTGQCHYTCETGYENCDGDWANGCEVALQSDVKHCGGCNQPCECPEGNNGYCQNGQCNCFCGIGSANCDKSADGSCEVNLLTDFENCGACGNSCGQPNTAGTCQFGHCEITCIGANVANCDGDMSNGCERLDTMDNCGACGNSCHGIRTISTCIAGTLPGEKAKCKHMCKDDFIDSKSKLDPPICCHPGYAPGEDAPLILRYETKPGAVYGHVAFLARKTSYPSLEVDCGKGGVHHVEEVIHPLDNLTYDQHFCVYRSRAGIYELHISGDTSGLDLRCEGVMGASPYLPRPSDESRWDLNPEPIEVKQWGTYRLSTISDAFAGCHRVRFTASDSPNLSPDAAKIGWPPFKKIRGFNEDLRCWDVSQLTTLSGFFSGAEDFNQPLDTWDVSNVTNMSSLFDNARSFNQPLDMWDVSNVTKMASMFRNAFSFNQPLNTWHISKVESTNEMFKRAFKFNQPLDTWDTSRVKWMSAMFMDAQDFNQPLNTWNTSNVRNMSGMFSNAHKFNQPLDRWNTSRVEHMGGMFKEAKAFNQDISGWDVSNVTNMNEMFYSAIVFNKPLNAWDTSRLTTMYGIFRNTQAFNQPLDRWDTSKVTIMDDAFHYAHKFNQDISNWNVENVTSWKRIFSECFLSDAYRPPKFKSLSP